MSGATGPKFNECLRHSTLKRQMLMISYVAQKPDPTLPAGDTATVSTITSTEGYVATSGAASLRRSAAIAVPAVAAAFVLGGALL